MPTEAEIQTQWKNAVDLLEDTRAFSDSTVAPAGGLLDVLLQSLEGSYTPDALGNAARSFRSTLSSLVNPSRILEFLSPILYDYAKIVSDTPGAGTGFGSGYVDLSSVMRAIYEHFVANALSVQSRDITYDITATLGAGNIGNGSLHRLTLDENAHALEACHVERKIWRCRADQNSGVQEHAESFEMNGAASPPDDLLRSTHGSGASARTFIRAHHAGAAQGGSILRNSSFSDFSATAAPKFSGWSEAAGGAQLSKDAVNFYRSHPGANGNDASLKITGGSGTVTIKQAIADMRVSRLDADRPYFLRVMINGSVGTAAGGTFALSLGSQIVTVSVDGLDPGWNEVVIPFDEGCWFRNFNADPMDIEIEWSGSTSGFLLVDDAIFAPWDLVDGTYWLLVGGTTPFLLDDTLTFTDLGGAPATAKIQWYLFISGLGYLPSKGTPTFQDP
jgi:hypothetical protein